MGTKMAPTYAGIFMSSLEGYIDDIFVLWEHGQDAFDNFLQSLNSINPTINFTWEVDTSQITFLDVDIYVQHQGNSSRLAYKKNF